MDFFPMDLNCTRRQWTCEFIIAMQYGGGEAKKQLSRNNKTCILQYSYVLIIRYFKERRKTDAKYNL